MRGVPQKFVRCCEGQLVISFAAIDAMRMDLAFRSGGSCTLRATPDSALSAPGCRVRAFGGDRRDPNCSVCQRP